MARSKQHHLDGAPSPTWSRLGIVENSSSNQLLRSHGIRRSWRAFSSGRPIMAKTSVFEKVETQTGKERRPPRLEIHFCATTIRIWVRFSDPKRAKCSEEGVVVKPDAFGGSATSLRRVSVI
ncbi:hypothetical protein MRX96_003689 [Rhipicephalus microplus]